MQSRKTIKKKKKKKKIGRWKWGKCSSVPQKIKFVQSVVYQIEVIVFYYRNFENVQPFLYTNTL